MNRRGFLRGALCASVAAIVPLPSGGYDRVASFEEIYRAKVDAFVADFMARYEHWFFNVGTGGGLDFLLAGKPLPCTDFPMEGAA